MVGAGYEEASAMAKAGSSDRARRGGGTALGAVLALAAGLALASPAAAESAHGIAMHGAPKYGPAFAHLDYANPDAPKGGTLRLGVTGSFDTLNPFIIKGVPAAGRHYVFESLLKRTWDEPFSLYGSIAASVEVPDDRSWVAFTLRPEARWHDGSPITADDVVFSFETLRDQGRPNHRLFYGKVAHIERPDPRTVKFVFGPEGDRELPLIMGLMPIISKAYYTAADFTKSTLEPPLGNGPYRIESVDPGRSIVYRRVTDYWARDLPINRGHYNFERVRYDYYRDSTVLMEAFTSGDYDLRREGSAVRWATAYGIPAVADGRVKRELLPHRRPAGMRAFVFNTRRALFADRRVREALGFAFDFEWLNENLLHGAYVRTDSYFANSELASRGAPSVREQALLTPYRGRLADEVFTRAFVPPATDGTGNVRENLKAARALLGEAGWRVREGALRDGASRAFAFEIMLVRPDNERIALAYMRNLERLGISARVRTVDTAQYEARRRAYDYDMIIHRWGVTLSPGNEQAYYWGSEAAVREGTRNYAGISDPAIDGLIAHVTAARERASLVAGIRALDRALLWGHYVVPLYHLTSDRVAYWDLFGRPQLTPLYGYVIETWWRDPARAAALGR